MFFRKKTPKRLYIPTKSRWYTRPRRQSAVEAHSRRLLKSGWWSGLVKLVKNRMALIMVGLCLGAFMLILASSSYFSIKRIEVLRENFNINSAAIENELNPYIGKNIIFLPRRQITATIREKFPEFSVIKITKDFPSRLEINLEGHGMVANLRAYYTLPEPSSETTAEFSELNRAIAEIENTGTSEIMPEAPPAEPEPVVSAAFDLDPRTPEKKEPEPIEQKSLLNRVGQAIFDQEENLELMTVVIKGLDQPLEDREQVIPMERMDYLMETLQYFNNATGGQVVWLEYLPNAREVHVKTEGDLVLWIALDQSYKDQIDKFKTIYEPAELSKESIAYIDLRIREKVIYCPKGAPCDRSN